MLSLQPFQMCSSHLLMLVHGSKTFNARSAVAMLPTFYLCSAMRQPTGAISLQGNPLLDQMGEATSGESLTKACDLMMSMPYLS